MGLLPEDPQQRQRVLLGVLVVALLGYGGHRYVYTPRSQQVDELQSRLERLEEQNATARSLAQGAGVSDAEARLNQYRQHLSAVERLIPSSEELPDLLDMISVEAQRTGVDLSLIEPVGASDEEYYTRRTYDLAVLGSYHDIGEFLTRIASLPRIITPVNVNLTLKGDSAAAGASRLEAKFAVETYVLPSPAMAGTTPAPDSANAE